MPDGTIAESNVTGISGNDFTVDPLPGVPVDGAMWGLTANEIKPQKFKVLSISESENLTFKVTAVSYDQNKFARVESGITFMMSRFLSYQRVCCLRRMA
ncbi:MAG: hypothetical protein V7739_11005 [Motiliproteus sp.]